MSVTRQPLALTYHGVADVPLRRDPQGLYVRRADLRRHIRALRRWGYRLVTFGELARRATEGTAGGHAALTFDDGFADNLHALAPILDELDAPATVFVVSGWLGEPLPWAPESRVLTADEVRALHSSGVEIGAHTVTHPDLTELPPERAAAELGGSRHDLEAVLQAPVDTAAYPWGRATAETREAARAAGFRAAARISGDGSWDEPLNLPRQNMNNWSSIAGLRLKRDDRYESTMRRPLPRVARRAARMARRVVR